MDKVGQVMRGPTTLPKQVEILLLLCCLTFQTLLKKPLWTFFPTAPIAVTFLITKIKPCAFSRKLTVYRITIKTLKSKTFFLNTYVNKNHKKINYSNPTAFSFKI